MINFKTVSTLSLICSFLVACSGADTPVQSGLSSPSANPDAAITKTKAKADLTPMERGKILFKRCRACHTLEEGGRNKVGPNLWAIWGSEAGSREGFAYSKALKASAIVWDDEIMDAYIKKPKEAVPGTRMSFIGLKKAQDREDLMLYLKAQTNPQ